ncbi:MAG: RtcB family protein [Planctomycetaceae bacterium]
MNASQLRKIGIPQHCIPQAIRTIQTVAKDRGTGGLKQELKLVAENPSAFVDDASFGGLAKSILEEQAFTPPEPIAYRTWGSDIDKGAHDQMKHACALPVARGAALMPDAHIGYGLPIGGVLATEDAVIPYAVGVDIACRMKLSVLDLPVSSLDEHFHAFRDSIEKGTRFGVGSVWQKPQSHEVMDRDWTVSRITRENRDKAWKQLGTSGSGNHFVEYGVLTLPHRDEELGLDAGQFVALLSHSGSRGPGAAVCSTYSAIAQKNLPSRYKDFGRLAWLDMNSQAGQEYWAAMNLMGEYAAANHAVIHQNVAKLIGAEIVAGVENHHNFAWKERHGDKDLYVHRKGATPAAAGVLGVIPGSMADPAFVVRGKGGAESLDSASHGAGRRMSRTAAFGKYNFKQVRKELAAKGVHVISAGADEVPGVYKNILDVMAEQADLVDVIGRFDPKIVKMCGDGSKAED